MINYNNKVVGQKIDFGSFDVTKDLVESYCSSVNENNPLYLDESVAKQSVYGKLIAPPLIFVSVQFDVELPDPEVNFGNARFLAGQKVESFHPIYIGDTIQAVGSITDVYEKTGRTGTMVFVVNQTEYFNQDNILVATRQASMVHREVESE
ncbi:MAG: MaoC family dehydratase N-terminal domain-containing protein [Dehalococcoidia bacterium]|tara:strand:- start:338 stop:790 length:453 start_codon:yes stop_codon:yes gene_type:complete